MQTVPLIVRPVGHAGRLEALDESNLLDSLAEESFDRFTRLTSAMLGTKASLVSLVDRERQFIKSQTGLEEPVRTARETPLSYSFCKLVVESGQPLVVEDARLDERVSSNPAVWENGVIAYLGMPVATRDGYILGSLCAMENHPRKWSPRDMESLSDLAGAVMREIELTDRSCSLIQVIKDSESDDKTRQRELRLLAHDLRTPAGAISSCMEMLVGDAATYTPDQLELLQLSQESAERLLLMIQQILEIDQIHAVGSSALKLTSVSASLILRRAARVIRPFTDESGVFLDTGVMEQLIYIKADEELIERVLLNLLTNAIKYSPVGGTIKVRIEETVEEGRLMCRFTVSDQGPGVPDDEKLRIFDQFVTGSTPSQRGMSSFGIGLSFSKSVAESHGGKIGVTDAPGGGSIFHFLLPISDPPLL